MKNLHLLPTDKPSEEVWKDVISYEGLYQVSNFGNVKSLGNNFTRKERLLKLSPQSKGYLTVVLQKKKMQQERMYSEDDMIMFADFFHNYKELLKKEKWEILEMSKEDIFKKWIEKVKKK